MEIIKIIFLNSIITMAALFGSIVAAGLLLGLLNRVASTYMQLAVGWWGILATAWVGTPVHEAGHALMCVIFRHKITELKLFQNSKDGNLGFVKHSYNPSNVYQRIGNFFIGIAPILTGTGVVLLLMLVFVPSIIGDLWNISSWPNFLPYLSDKKFWVFMFFATSVAAHMNMSLADLKGAVSGVVAIFIIVLAINIIFAAIGFKITALSAVTFSYNTYVIFGLLLAVICSLFNALISMVLYAIRRCFN